jgi:hypothetical protein
VIPLGQKDHFNATQPPTTQELRQVRRQAGAGAPAERPVPGSNVPEDNRTDIVQALLTGIPGLNQITTNPPPTDTLKINLGIRSPRRPAASACWRRTRRGSRTGAGCRRRGRHRAARRGGILVKNTLPWATA